jgi:ferredoxin--NADP+ reductase
MYISHFDIAKNAKPGQFVILMPHKTSERIPLTIAGVLGDKVRVIFQIVGATTLELSRMNDGDELYAFTGPLGKPTDLSDISSLAIVGGGLGVAISLPLAISADKNNISVTNILGFRNKDLIILDDEFKGDTIIMTDDGSNGNKGFVTHALEDLLKTNKPDKIITIGPMPMMRAVGELGEKYNVPVSASMNSIMIDGTGMCGACRLIVDGQVKFACVDGPEFDASSIDWNTAINRSRAYKAQEEQAYHECRLLGENT